MKKFALTAIALAFALVLSQGAAHVASASSSAIVDAASCMQHELPRNDDGYSEQVDLPFPINFYGTIRNKLWVNNNGNVTFNGGLSTYTPFGLASTREAIIAPFFADVDTTGAGSDVVRWGWGDLTYDNHRAFCVNWTNVGYFSGGTDKLNSFQLIIVDRSLDVGSGAFDIVFNYGQIQWETGSASGGAGGLGGSSAVAGFASGSGTADGSVELPGSAIPGSFLDSSPTALVKGKLGSNIPGRYVFNVRGDGVIGSQYVALGDSFQSGEGAYNYTDGTDTASNKCHRSNDAYPHLLVRDQVVHLQLKFRACSGAVMADLASAAGNNKPPYDDGSSQYSALGVDTKLVTIGIVGNDLDFAGTVANCVKTGIFSPTAPWIPACQVLFGAGVDEKMRSLDYGNIRSALGEVYRDIKHRAPFARIIAISYPKFFPKNGSLVCPSGIIRLGDQLWMNSAISKADKLIGDIAKSNGVEYVNMGSVTKDHEICSSEPAQNGVVFSSDFSPLSESYHPNTLGHRLMADRIETYLGGPVVPTFTIQPLERLSQYVTVTGRALNVAVNWPGSDVVTSLVSPTGIRYDRNNIRTALHDLGPTFETWQVANPELGQWTIEYFGAVIADGGEPVSVDIVDEQPSNLAPVVSFTTTNFGRTFTFDASATVDPDGSVDGYVWDFGDGTTSVGKIVQHTFPADARFQVMLAASDNVGETGFYVSPQIVDTRNLQPVPSQQFTSNTTLTNTTVLGGSVEIDGNLECNSEVQIMGDLVVTGTAHLTNNCRVGGSLYVGGELIMDSTPKISGNIFAGGNIKFQSTATVGGAVAAGGSFISIDGKTSSYLQATHRVGGKIAEHAVIQALRPTLIAPLTLESVSGGVVATSWGKWMNATASANAAPSWSAGLTSTPGCTMASWSSSVNGTSVAVLQPTLIDARAETSSCSAITIQGMTLRLSANLTIVADSIKAIGGIQVRSADGAAHKVIFVIPGSTNGCLTGRDISIPNGATADPNVSVEFHTPGRLAINGPTALKGFATSGCWSGTGSVSVLP